MRGLAPPRTFVGGSEALWGHTRPQIGKMRFGSWMYPKAVRRRLLSLLYCSRRFPYSYQENPCTPTWRTYSHLANLITTWRTLLPLLPPHGVRRVPHVTYTPIQRTQLPPGELYSYHKKPTILQDRSCLLMKY